MLIAKKPLAAVKRAATIFTLTQSNPKPSKLLDSLGVVGQRHYVERPRRCSICSCTTISTLEIVGLSDDPVFWECEDCGALFCIKKKQWICDTLVEKLYGCWTIPQLWEDDPKQEDLN